MKQLEKNKEYKIYLMPDIKNPSQSIKELRMTSRNNPNHLISLYYSYALFDDKIEVFRFGKTLKDFIYKTRLGYIGTSEGYYICDLDEDITEYYAFPDKSNITIIEASDDNGFINPEEYVRFTDIVEYEPNYLNDIKSEYDIYIKTEEDQGFMKLSHIGLSKRKPLFVDGDSQEDIIKMYEGIDDIDEVIENFKNENIEKFVFGEEARKLRAQNIMI